MRLIDADALGLTDMEIILCDGSYKDALKILLDKIETAETINVPTPSVQQWVPCSERLPEKEGHYLTSLLHPVDEWYHKPTMVIGIMYYDHERGFFDEGRTKAWMPLPKPYKGEKHD